MGNRNYTNYSKQNNQKKEERIGGKVQTDETVTNPKPQSDENVQNIPKNTETTETVTNAAPKAQTTQPEPETPEAVIGVVVNCEKLNIRADADKTAEVLCVINKGEEVEIDEEDSTDDFYSVIYGKTKEVSVYGFCMKQYIKIK